MVAAMNSKQTDEIRGDSAGLARSVTGTAAVPGTSRLDA